MPTQKPSGGSSGSTRTFDRSLALLVAVTEQRDGARMTDLARETGLSTSTASRLLATLEGHQLTRRDEDGRYRPGTQLIQVAASVLRDLPLYELAGPHLVALAEETGETANLGLLNGEGRVLYLRQAQGSHLVQTAFRTGRTVPVKGTAIGAAIMGRVGPGGFAVARGTIEPDVCGVAAQVVGHVGEAVAGLSLIAPTYRTTDADVERYGLALVRHAGDLSQKLGAPPESLTLGRGDGSRPSG